MLYSNDSIWEPKKNISIICSSINPDHPSGCFITSSVFYFPIRVFPASFFIPSSVFYPPIRICIRAVRIRISTIRIRVLSLPVPRGSNLGHKWFLIYINDLPNCLEITHSNLFADDTILTSQGHLSIDIEYKLNKALCTDINVICAMQIMLAILVGTYISALMSTSGR